MSILPNHILSKIADPKERAKLGKAGITACEALHQEAYKLERKLHDDFSNWCRRNGIIVWHSRMDRRSSIL